MRFQSSAASPRAIVARDVRDRLRRRLYDARVSGIVPPGLKSALEERGCDPGEWLMLLLLVETDVRPASYEADVSVGD